MHAEPIAWLNGEYIPLKDASLSVFDATVTGGVSVTERLRTFRHNPFLLELHVERLMASAQAAYIPVRTSVEALSELIREVVRKNAELTPPNDDLSISAFVTAGQDGKTTTCIFAMRIPAHVYVVEQADGIALATPVVSAIPPESLSPQIKTRSRLHWHIADAQVRAKRPGARAILLDAAGRLTETSTGNLFVFDGARLLTPRRERTLHGISQAFVIELATRIGLVAREADLSASDLVDAREAFVTSSVSCIVPVREFDEHRIGDGHPGPVQRQLLETWSADVGVDIVGQMSRMAREERTASLD
jgi:branched-subunit amino acid aminotransferase/4-amino-4-deoxychorismate lyase